jgi:hypothetical protein
MTCGHYLRGRVPNEPACLVLYWSEQEATPSFRLMTFAWDGVCLSYHAGHEILTTPEFEVLSATCTKEFRRSAGGSIQQR